MFTNEQLQLLRINKVIPAEASPEQAEYFFEVCKRKKLDPFLKHVHMIERNESDGKGGWKKGYTIQASLDGMRAIAQRNVKIISYKRAIRKEDGETLGICEIETADRGKYYDEVPLSEYIQKTKTGEITKFWKQFPTTMIKKVAEESVLRMLCPEDLSGVYGDDEMSQADVTETPKIVEQAKVLEIAEKVSQPIVQIAEKRSEMHPGQTFKPAPDVQAVLDRKPISDPRRMLDEIDGIEMLGTLEELDEWQKNNLSAIKALSKADFAKIVEAGKAARKNLNAKKGKVA